MTNDRPTSFMMRGFAKFPQIGTMEEVYGLRSAAVAVYPMYRGLAKLVGMTVVEPGKTVADQMEVVKQEWETFDFFFIHYKYTDSTGEDGNFPKKVEMIEGPPMPRMPQAPGKRLSPDVLIVTGEPLDAQPDEVAQLSTPSRRSWALATVRPDLVNDRSAKRPVSAGWLRASSWPRASCPWPWPTRAGSRSSARDRRGRGRKGG